MSGFTIRELLLTAFAASAALLLVFCWAVYCWHRQPNSKAGRIHDVMEQISAKADEARRLAE